MSRRRRAEPAFGSDSFLDVVSNLVGIVLIIIVMVGAHIRELPNLATVETPKPPPVALDPAREQIDAYAGEVAELQQRLLATLRETESVEKKRTAALEQQRQVRAARSSLAVRTAAEEKLLADRRQALAQAHGQVPNLRQRLDELRKAVSAVEERPSERRLIRFHLPVSKPVDAEELLFECQQGRVTFADVQALLEEAQRDMPHRAEELRTRWSVTASVGPVGAFQMRYTLERERSGSFARIGDLPPAEERQFRYGVGRWELIPVWPERGDTAADALKDGSRLRTIIDALDPEQTALTFFVYPDSFDLFRELRDYLHERGFVVAGRPLPPGYPIFGSKHGSLSRGQ